MDKLIQAIKVFVPNVTWVHYWTNNPTSQYRNKLIFSCIANHSSIYGIYARWNYWKILMCLLYNYTNFKICGSKAIKNNTCIWLYITPTLLLQCHVVRRQSALSLSLNCRSCLSYMLTTNSNITLKGIDCWARDKSLKKYKVFSFLNDIGPNKGWKISVVSYNWV